MKNVLTYLLSRLYGLAVSVRNLLYDEHLLYVYKPSLPTICVGNMTVGGTGKTPHVEYIVELLMRKGYKVAVLSRGYKRKTKGFLLASADSTADQIGDEPRQMQRKFPDLTVAVCEDRVRGIRRLSKQVPDLDVVVLDDAFQHRKIRCGLNILLTPADNLYVHDSLLPYGRLREPVFGASRADMVVVTKCPESMQPIDRRVVLNHLRLATFQELCFSSIAYAQEQQEQLRTHEHVYLLTGIADPHYIVQFLGEKVAAHLAFPDHHHFTLADLARIAETFVAPYPIVTTEKDYVRLADSSLLSDDLKARLLPLPIRMVFSPDDENAFQRRILQYVHEHTHKH